MIHSTVQLFIATPFLESQGKACEVYVAIRLYIGILSHIQIFGL